MQVQPTLSDTLLITRLQAKVKDLERDRTHLQREVERQGQRGSRSSPDEDAEKEISDAIKVCICLRLVVAATR